MSAKHKETQHLKVIFLTDFSYRKEVAQRFGHFLVINIQEMHCAASIAQTVLAVAGLALCDLIFMVRENQILAACMNVNLHHPDIFLT